MYILGIVLHILGFFAFPYLGMMKAIQHCFLLAACCCLSFPSAQGQVLAKSLGTSNFGSPAAATWAG